ncbi:MAG: SpoIID/LytB domain-containing protein [Candidatus Syntrophonatronum acetioxidans]|uniref:SpoIID/LytB domain-containing protein n=1 Tax=Candidatus Syntrophonatronum acetioxidans TaxID=1795816 RepID=A0A424YHD1_9FIRM|nr:MAG: SpoIID/LytB domain-containing protein [Candidatus Syntrophonatronum acetioxidans]
MCKKIVIMVLFLTMVFPAYVQGNDAGNELPKLKVCILKEVSEVIAQVPSGYSLFNQHNDYKLEDLEGEVIFKASEKGIKVKASDGSFEEVLTGPIRIKKNGNAPCLVKIKETRYRGEIIISRQGSENKGTLQAINYLDVESYLRGVVPREMPVSWHMEALKAQAVTARTYALRSLGRHKNEGYDLCCGQHCQVYGGADAEFDRSDEAVKSTEGRVLTYQGQLAQTFYHATNGGHTEAPENVWSHSLPYLKSIPDPYDDPTREDIMVHHRAEWGPLELTRQDLKKRLESHGVDIGRLLEVRIKERASSGRVIDLEFVGTEGSYNALREKARTIFSYADKDGTSQPGLNSQMFDLEINTRVFIKTAEGKREVSRLEGAYALTAEGKKRINEENVHVKGAGGETFTVSAVPSMFTISGFGWGHGVGMSQNGAYNRAIAGHTYREILDFYFPGTGLEKWH